jgi:hypothetical protein
LAPARHSARPQAVAQVAAAVARVSAGGMSEPPTPSPPPRAKKRKRDEGAVAEVGLGTAVAEADLGAVGEQPAEICQWWLVGGAIIFRLPRPFMLDGCLAVPVCPLVAGAVPLPLGPWAGLGAMGQGPPCKCRGVCL